MVCTVFTKQQRKTSSSSHVFSFSLLSATRCAPPLNPPQKTAPRRMCGFLAFDRVKAAELQKGPRRNNPTIQDQACNSRGKAMCCKPTGEKEDAKETQREGTNGRRPDSGENVLEKRRGMMTKGSCLLRKLQVGEAFLTREM